MIRFRLKELIAEREFKENRVITLAEVATATGIHRVTLSKIGNNRGQALRVLWVLGRRRG
jgi:putative transcriptional regulator